MSKKYTLTYFPVKALGEPIRLLLAYGNIKFDDIRISSEDWPKYKDSMPMGQMPVLQIGDEKIFQSTAISRYLGKQLKIAGADDWESLKIDMVIDTIHDLRIRAASIFYDSDEATKDEKYKMLQTEVIPFFLKKLDEIAAKNKGYLALGKLTWADFYFAGIADYMNRICRTDIFVGHPNLKAVVDNVNALPSIKAWYQKAPETEY